MKSIALLGGETMKIILLGGTGAMGSHLSNILSHSGDKVFVTSRARRASTDSIEYIQGNAKELNFLSTILQQTWDVIVDFMIYSEDELEERLDLLLDSTSQYIFLSSARVYDNSKEAIIEDSPRLLDSSTDKDFLLTNEYSLSKARQENMLYSAAKRNWTIIRPYITYSEHRMQLGTLEKENWLYRALKGRTIVFSEDIQNRLTTLTYGLDVATGIAKLINNSNSLGETFHITSESVCKWSDVLNIYLNVLENRLGERPRVILQDLHDFLDWNVGKYQIIYDRLFDRQFDNTKINGFIDTEEFVQVEIGLTKCLNTFLDNPEFKSINWRSEAKKDRFSKEVTPLKEIDGLKQKIKYLVSRYLF